jgi:hypothetical protein
MNPKLSSQFEDGKTIVFDLDVMLADNNRSFLLCSKFKQAKRITKYLVDNIHFYITGAITLLIGLIYFIIRQANVLEILAMSFLLPHVFFLTLFIWLIVSKIIFSFTRFIIKLLGGNFTEKSIENFILRILLLILGTNRMQCEEAEKAVSELNLKIKELAIFNPVKDIRNPFDNNLTPELVPSSLYSHTTLNDLKSIDEDWGETEILKYETQIENVKMTPNIVSNEILNTENQEVHLETNIDKNYRSTNTENNQNRNNNNPYQNGSNENRIDSTKEKIVSNDDEKIEKINTKNDPIESEKISHAPFSKGNDGFTQDSVNSSEQQRKKIDKENTTLENIAQKKDEKKYSEENENSKIKTSKIKSTKAQFETLRNLFRFGNSSDVNRKINFNNLNDNRQLIGIEGEKFVIKLLESRMHSIYCDNQIVKIEHVSLLDDSLGYDILIELKCGLRKYIEVKSTRQNEKTAFFMTQNEINAMEKLENYYVYRVFNLDEKAGSAKYYIIDCSKDFSKYYSFQATVYEVTPK